TLANRQCHPTPLNKCAARRSGRIGYAARSASHLPDGAPCPAELAQTGLKSPFGNLFLYAPENRCAWRIPMLIPALLRSDWPIALWCTALLALGYAAGWLITRNASQR